MEIEVYVNEWKISESDYLIGKVSQCVATGLYNTKNNLGGLVHIHSSNNHKKLIDQLLEKLIKFDPVKENYRLLIGGGVDAFIPTSGFIHGQANADRVIDYLVLIGLESNISVTDIYSDYVRKLIISPKKRLGKIVRIDEQKPYK